MLLRVDKALNDEIITDSGVKLFIDPTYRKEWCSAVTATIVELPVKSSPKDKKILKHLRPGDEVCMSYQVVADFEFADDTSRFMQATEDNPYCKEFVNGNGDWVRCYALPKFKGLSKIQWVGVYQDKFKRVISGVQGTEREMERWMAQFQFGKTDIYSFSNYFEYNGNDYWKCNPSQIFARRVDGHLVAVGDRVICKPIEEDVPDEIKRSLAYSGDVKIRYQDRGRVISGGKEKGLKKDWIVSFNPGHCEKYEFFGKQYFLIKQNYIQGIWQSRSN